ncbi:hypothetical protein [Desulfovibrio litoralis]|uniref:Uncharacterized protein n=1 Tax=Desulfovibrio litoralis DSM 11393 TaxID=1121455 RepID=A0A1M7T6C7_9BACT|nr:hypothetical protein [Desulfovibrio litoralis]SHN66301.1 hypothetical protein SAMN02745728_01613 [Desulfovibrio litoralis DSM 11393]
MSQTASEMILSFIYSPELSYSELLETESVLKEELAELLSKYNAFHLLYETSGDTFKVQCSFNEYNTEFCREFARELLEILHQQIEAKIIFVDKEAHSVIAFTLFNHNCEELQLNIPHSKSFEALLVK